LHWQERFRILRIMKMTFPLLILAAPLLFAQPQEAPRGPQVTAVDGYAARVNNAVITYGEVRDHVAPYLQQLAQQLQGQELAQRIQAAYLEAREALIEEALLKAEVESLGLNLPEKAVNDEVDRMIRERFNNDRALLARALADRRMTFEEWKKEIAGQITIRVFYNQEVVRRADVSAQAVRAEYERSKEKYFIPFRVRYRFILINKGSTEEDLAAKRALAENTLQKLKSGADFAAAAKEVSEGDTAVTSWRDPADVRDELRPALRETPAGQISGLIETSGEFYILRIEERREEGYIPFEDVQKKIEAELLDAERKRLHERLIERITAKHFVERY